MAFRGIANWLIFPKGLGCMIELLKPLLKFRAALADIMRGSDAPNTSQNIQNFPGPS